MLSGLGCAVSADLGITTGNDDSLIFALTARTRPLPSSFPEDSIGSHRLAMSYVLELLSGAPTMPVPMGDVQVTFDGSTGFGYNCCHDKRAALLNHWDECALYLTSYREAPPPVWTFMHKRDEVLPRAKCLTRTRPIIYPPLHFYMLQKVHTQELDERMKRVGRVFAYGIRVLNEGFTEICSELLEREHLFKGDCSQFDASVGPAAFGVICQIRKALADPQSHDALDFVYSQLSSKEIVLPSGQVVLDTRQPSGQACTTSDNSLFHAYVLFRSYIQHVHACSGRVPSYTELFSHLSVFLYSDDHIAATDDPTFCRFDIRRLYYESFGLVLKPDDDMSGGVIYDYTFLGGRFVDHPFATGRYVYEYDDPDWFDYFLARTGYMTQRDIAMSICSYARIVAPSETKYGRLAALSNALSTSVGWHATIDLPSRRSILDAAAGFERS